MKKFVLVPDSFKGTLSSVEVCAIMEDEIKIRFPSAQVVSIPVADGGEGSVDCFLKALGGERITVTVNGPFFEPHECFYGRLPDGVTAVIEMAACAGLPLAEGRLNPMTATTFGVGELILHAAKSGAKRIVVGLGGSATNDGGCGAAAAAGVKFFDENGAEFVPTGGSLTSISRIDASGVNQALQGVEIVTMCDIDNPMYGKTGAAYVFGPQKGATTEGVELLDNNLRHLACKINYCLGLQLDNLPGSGAAGAMGAGMVAFFGSRLQMGIETVLDTVHFEELSAGADMVFTGEGRMDEQSLRGKVVIGVARRGRQLGVPVVAVVGGISDNIDAAYAEGVSAVFSICREPRDFEYVRPQSKDNLRKAVSNILRLCESLKA